MTTTQLGSGMNNSTRLDGALSTLDQLASQIESRVTASVMATVRAYCDAMETPTPIVNVAPASVTVEASSPVTIPAPAVNVDFEVPGLEALAVAQAETNTRLARLETLLSRPVTRTVHRDADGLIASVTESR